MKRAFECIVGLATAVLLVFLSLTRLDRWIKIPWLPDE